RRSRPSRKRRGPRPAARSRVGARPPAARAWRPGPPGRRGAGLLRCRPRPPARAPSGSRAWARRARRSPLPLSEVEHREERLLGHLDRADLLHPLLAFLLLLDQLPLAGDVAAVALREHVLAPRLHGLAGDHTGADRGLDRDVEHLPRDLLAKPLDERAPAVIREVAVDDQR